MKMVWKPFVTGVVVVMALAAAPAAAQTPAQSGAAAESPWSFDVGFGLDNSISGNINSGGVGQINNQAVVILKNSYEDVYGTGIHFRFGGGYMLSEASEVRVTFTFQSLDADLTRLGDIGTSNLYGQYSDYQSFGVDVGLRRYVSLTPKLTAYGEGTIGLGFIDENDVTLVAPGANLGGEATDFYDKTSAFTFGVNAGLLVGVTEKIGIYGQLGLRYVSGMSSIDFLEGTGLETVNDSSSRWTIPFIAGVRVRF